MTSPTRRWWLPWALTVVFALVAAVVIVVSVNSGGDEPPVARPCTTRTPVTVAASSEKSTLLTQLAQRYNTVTARPTDRCGTVTVTTVNSGDAATAFSRGWDEGALGQRPDVWSPASSSWVGIARAKGQAADVVPESGPSLAQTPLVIAMPRPMAQALGWPDRTIGWTDLKNLAADPRGWGAVNHPEWGPFTLGKTDPNVSTSGLYALLGAFQAAPGGPSGDELTTAKVNDPQALDFEKSLENGVVHYGSTELEFLENLYRAAGSGPDGALKYVSAVAVEEKSVWDYNAGNPRGDPLTLGMMPAPSTPLVAFAPTGGTYVSDSPYLVLDDVSGDKRTAADDFGAWLLEPTQQQAFQRSGFRDAAGRPGIELSRQNGFPAAPARALPLPSAATAGKALDAWPGLRKPANVVLVIDRSGSMGDPIPGQGTRTFLDQVLPPAERASFRLAPGDTVSLWSFSSAAGGQPPYTVDVPPDPVIRNAPAVSTALQGLKNRTKGDTALYRTTRDAVAALRQTYDPSRINAVILLTDGADTEEGAAGIAATQQAVAPDPSRPVRAFFIAYSKEGDFDALKDIGLASGGYAYDARDPSQIDKAFTDVLSNF